MARSALLEGALRALTLAPGIVPVGVLFGATAAAAGVPPLAAAAMSALVFAGTAQFAAVGLVATGATLASAVALVALINSRYLLLSAATLELGRKAGASAPQRVALALGVVDETYALQAAWAKQAATTATGLLAVSGTFWTMWVGATLAGGLVGERLPDLAPYGLDYALPGIAVGLLGIFADSRPRLLAGLAALALAGGLALAGLGTLAILTVPPALAFALGRWGPRGG